MPRQRSPSRLQPLCLKQIVELLWQWRLNSRAKFPDEVDQMMRDYFHLPAVFTDSLLDGLKDDHFLYTGHVTLLLKLGLTKLSIVGDYYVDFDLVMKYTSHCMKHIVSLDISRHWLEPANMEKLPEVIPNVEILRLQFTRVSDHILELIGRYCSQLHLLDVSYCPVTDTGVMGLCARCKKLKKLYLGDTRVSIEGAAYILATLPQLEELGVNSIVNVLSYLHALQLQSGQLNKADKHGLRSLRLVLEAKSAQMKAGTWNQAADEMAIAQGFHIVVGTCPQLESIIINDWHPQQEWCLQMLSHCKHLSQIELDVRSYPYLTMNAIYPLLANSTNLDTLTLRHVISVSLPLLATCCGTRLRCLTLDDNTYVLPPEEESKAPLPFFEALEILTLMGKFQEDVLLLALTTCPGLRELEVTHNYNLTYELLTRALARNPLSQLGILILHECDRVNLQSLQLLLQSDNDLYDIEIHNCRISDTQFKQLLQWMAVAIPNAGVEFDFETRMGGRYVPKGET